jgi:hypothetical protein
VAGAGSGLKVRLTLAASAEQQRLGQPECKAILA